MRRSQTPSPASEPASGFARFSVEGMATTVHYRRLGSGEPLLLVHGLGASSTAWTVQMSRLSGEFAVYGIDLPGFGLSPAPADGRLEGEWFAACLESFVEALGLGPVHLVGHSMAGALVTLLALRRPDLVRSLVLVAPAGLGRELSRSLRFLCIPGVAGLLTAVAPRLLAALGPERAERMLRARAGDVDPELMVPLMREACAIYSRPAAVRSFMRSLKAGARFRGQRPRYYLLPRLHELKMPTLLMWGTRDGVLPLRHAFDASRVSPSLRLEILDGGGHSPHVEVPHRFAETLRAFLAGLSRQPGRARIA